MSNKVIGILTSDWHLQAAAWNKYPTLKGDSQHSVGQIIDRAMEECVNVYAAGDLLDNNHPTSEMMWWIIRTLNLLAKEGLKIIHVQGQHEKVAAKPWFSLTGQAIHAHQQALDIAGLNVYGIDYCRAEQMIEEVKLIPKETNLLLCHTPWKEFLPYATTAPSLEILPPVPIVLTGDLHKTLIQRRLGLNKEKFIVVSPGAACMQAIDEPADKYYFLLYEDLSVEQVPLKTRQVFRYAINTEEQLEEFLDEKVKLAFIQQPEVSEELSKNIVDVIYDNSIENIYDRIAQACSDKVHLFMRLVKQFKYEVSNSPQEDKDTNDLLDYLDSFCAVDSKEYKYIQRLLNSKRHIPEIEEIIKEELKC
jgi:hypothetical protein